MDKVSVTLTVFFEEPFWVGIFERVERGRLSVAKVVFGAEPTDAQVYLFVLKQYGQLQFGSGAPCRKREHPRNPKRIQREVSCSLQEHGIGTQSQNAIKLQQEALAQARKVQNRQRKDEKMQRQFALSQTKKKEKHRGH